VCGLPSVNGNKLNVSYAGGEEFLGQTGDCRISGKTRCTRHFNIYGFILLSTEGQVGETRKLF